MDRTEQERRWKRIRIVKRFLKLVPRRDNIHRYPILKHFANVARARTYLWSFRVTEVVPALYAGWILTLIPVMSVQISIACILAFLCRANIMILVLLQFVSTPFTVPFLWYIAYKVGEFFVTWFGTDRIRVIQQSYENISFDNIGAILTQGDRCVRCFFTTTLGGIILGVIIGHISGWIYKWLANRYRMKSEDKNNC